ncbi:MAG: hypothetical protein JSR68_08315 [Proteobacteria bacterium]|nr:hypothetical protein [Pseudomonadota bacterium]
MSWLTRIRGAFAGPPAPEAAPVARVAEAAAAQDTLDEPGFRRLTGSGAGSNERDLTPIAQDRMQRLAEYLWQSNLLANRLVELPLAYLLAEGVQLQSTDEAHQTALTAFWHDPINNWPLKLEARVRALALLGEQCYICHVGEGGFVRLGYLDPRDIATVVLDPDNPEQPIGVVTRRDAKGRAFKYRVVVLGNDAELFSRRTQQIRADDFADGECLLFQINKFPSGSRGRSDLLGQMDWLDAYDEFLFKELDRIDNLRTFAWDVTLAGADPEAVAAFEKKFQPPGPNGKFVHNDSVTLQTVSPQLQAAETTESARLLRNHVLGGATVPEHWFGGGGDVNRGAASEMGEPTFKMYTKRQGFLKYMLEEIGRYVVWKSSHQQAVPDWGQDRNLVQAVFPELANRDVSKFAAALVGVSQAVASLIEQGLMTQQTALRIIADVAQRFGQEIDATAELEAARAEHAARQSERAAGDAFGLRQQLLADAGGSPPPVAA